MAEKEIKVIVRGALGKIGQVVSYAVSIEPGLRLVGGVDLRSSDDLSGVAGAKVHSNLQFALNMFHPDVVVDFSTHNDTFMPAVIYTLEQGINMVIGTTGISEEELQEIERLAIEYAVGVVVAPNFSLGAVAMMYLSNIMAAEFPDFNYVDITELHHENKVDSPSGTALKTAEEMVKARGGRSFICVKTQKKTLPGARGATYKGISIHSVRSPGIMARQDIVFGAISQTLTISHNQISREGFCPGVIMAVKKVLRRKGGLTLGLDELMGL